MTYQDPASGALHVHFDPDGIPPSAALAPAFAAVHGEAALPEPPLGASVDVEALDAYLQSLAVPGGTLVTLPGTTCVVHTSGHLMAWEPPAVPRAKLLQFATKGVLSGDVTADAGTAA